VLLAAGVKSAFFRFYFDEADEAGKRRVIRTSFWFTMAMPPGLLAGPTARPDLGCCSTRTTMPTSSARRSSGSGRTSATADDLAFPGRAALDCY
jgi:hypothetical protein